VHRFSKARAVINDQAPQSHTTAMISRTVRQRMEANPQSSVEVSLLVASVKAHLAAAHNAEFHAGREDTDGRVRNGARTGMIRNCEE
jgi:hypothetical protein